MCVASGRPGFPLLTLQDCLRNHTGSLSWECKAQLFKRQLQADGDIRLSVRLLKKCMADKKRVRALVTGFSPLAVGLGILPA